MQYLVTVTQNHEYYVDAENEEQAQEKGLEEFYSDMRSVASTMWDECEVECLEDEDEDEG